MYPESLETTLGILLLDEDQKHLAVWSSLLTYVGCRVFTARNCLDAALHLSENIQCVLLDHHLDDLRGSEFIRRFRSPRGPAFLMLTDETSPLLNNRALHAGAAAVVPKSASLDELLSAIEKACAKIPHVPPMFFSRNDENARTVVIQ